MDVMLERKYPWSIPQPPKGNNCKHYRWLYDSKRGVCVEIGGDDGRALWTNPDGTVKIADGSFVNGLWSYHIGNDVWNNIYPYCGYPGEIMPGRPDEVGWVYDSKRDLYWMLPGFLGLTQSGPGLCGTGPDVAQQVVAIMVFDPNTNKWSKSDVPKEPIPPGEENSKWAIYDPLTDSIWRVRHSGGMGIVWDVLDITAKSWWTFQTAYAADGTYINDTHLGKEPLAFDRDNRQLYIVDPLFYRLFRLDMATRKIHICAQPPKVGSYIPNLTDLTLLVWRKSNGTIIYPYNYDAHAWPQLTTLLIYDPVTNSWTIGPTCRANSCIYDEANDALLLYGAQTGDGEPKPANFYIWTQDGGVAPSAPSNMTLAFT